MSWWPWIVIVRHENKIIGNYFIIGIIKYNLKIKIWQHFYQPFRCSQF